MAKRKRLEWTGKYRDQRAGKYRVWWSSGAWTLSYDGRRISRHDKRDGAKRKAATGARPTVKVANPKRRATNPARDEQARADIKAWTDKRIAARATGSVARLAADVAPSLGEPEATSHPDIADDGPAAQLLTSAGRAGVEPALVRAGDPATIAEQGRHDVAASVARHAELPERPPGWGRDLDAIEYEHTRRADPDPRDEPIEDEPPSAASLIAAVRTTLTPAEMDAADPPADVTTGIEAMAEAVDPSDDPVDPATKFSARAAQVTIQLDDEQLLAAIAESPPRDVSILAPPGSAGPVTFREGDASWHDGPGWYYTIDDYPDEGSCGAFATREIAVAHAKCCGHAVSIAESPPREPVTTSELLGAIQDARDEALRLGVVIPLSNFSAFTLVWDGQRFDTSEAVYHWEKFPLSVGLSGRDIGIRESIRRTISNATSAHEAFKIAEMMREHRRPDWDEVKVDIMRDILRAKANQHEYVRRKLLATGDRELVENSWRDSFWGWGPNRDGLNMLGKLWMEIRAELRATGGEP